MDGRRKTGIERGEEEQRREKREAARDRR